MSVLNEIRKTKHTGVGLPVGLCRSMRCPPMTNRIACRVNRFIMRVLEWMEQDDTIDQKLLAYLVAIIMLMYFIGAVIVWLA